MTAMPKHRSSPELQRALDRFSSFSHDLNLITSFLGANLSISSPSSQPMRRSKPTPRSAAWRKAREADAAETTAVVAAPSVSIPPGRREVLQHLISGAYVKPDSSVSPSEESGDVCEGSDELRSDMPPSHDSNHRKGWSTCDESPHSKDFSNLSDNPANESPMSNEQSDEASSRSSHIDNRDHEFEYDSNQDTSDQEDSNHDYSPPNDNRDGSAYEQSSDPFKQWGDFVSKTFQCDYSDASDRSSIHPSNPVSDASDFSSVHPFDPAYDQESFDSTCNSNRSEAEDSDQSCGDDQSASGCHGPDRNSSTHHYHHDSTNSDLEGSNFEDELEEELYEENEDDDEYVSERVSCL